MKLGISTASYFPKYLTEDTLELIANTGAKNCEIFFGSYSEYTNKFGLLLKNKLKKLDLSVHSVHALTQQFEPDMFSLGVRANNDGMKMYEKFLKTAQIIGAHYYTYHGPGMLKRVKYNFDYENLSNKINNFCEIAEKYEVKLCYENVHWTYFSSPEFFKNLKDKCPKLGSVLDIKQARQSQIDYKEYLKVMGDRLETVHVCDYNTDGITTMPGRGIFDFTEMFKILLDNGFNGGVLMEVYSKDYKDEIELQNSFNYLQECLYKIK